MHVTAIMVLLFIPVPIVLYTEDLLYNTLKEQLDSLHKIAYGNVRVVFQITRCLPKLLLLGQFRKLFGPQHLLPEIMPLKIGCTKSKEQMRSIKVERHCFKVLAFLKPIRLCAPQLLAHLGDLIGQ